MFSLSETPEALTTVTHETAPGIGQLLGRISSGSLKSQRHQWFQWFPQQVISHQAECGKIQSSQMQDCQS